MEAQRQKKLFGGSILPSGGLHPGPSSGPELDASHKLAKNSQASSSSSASGSKQGSSFAKNRIVGNLEVVEDVSDDSMNITSAISVPNNRSKPISSNPMFIPKNIQRRGVNNKSAPLGMRRENTTPISPAPFKSHAAKLDVQQDQPTTSSKGKEKPIIPTTTHSTTTSTSLRSGTSRPSTISYESLDDSSRPPKSASFLDTSSSPKLKIGQTARDAIAAALCKGEGEGTSKSKPSFAVEIPSRSGFEKRSKDDRRGNELASTSAASRKAQPFPMSDEDDADPVTLQKRTSPRHSNHTSKESAPKEAAQTKTMITPITTPPPITHRKKRHLPVDQDSDSDFARISPQPSPPRTRSQIDRKRKRNDITASTDPAPVGSTFTNFATESGAKKPPKPRPKPRFKADAETQQRAQGGLLHTIDQHIPSDTDGVAPPKTSSQRAKPFPLSPKSKLNFREINTGNDLPSSPPTPSSAGRCSSPPSSQSQQSPSLASPVGKRKRVLKKLKALQPFPLDSPGGGPSAPGSKTRGTHETPNTLHPFPMNSPDDGVTPRVRRSSSRLRGTKRVFSVSDEDSESATSASKSEYGSPAKRMKITKSHHGEGASSSANRVEKWVMDEDSIIIEKVDPKTLCPFCDEPWPSTPSPALMSLMRRIRPQSWPQPRLANPLGLKAPVHVFVDLCHMHRSEMSIIPAGIAKGWPETINFSALGKRIWDMSDEVRHIVDHKEQHHFYKAAKRDVVELGARKANSAKGQYDSFEKTRPGYYGERGLFIICQIMNDMFPGLTPLQTAPITPHEFTMRVLVPEVALLLIMQDLKLNKRDALATLEASGTYGVAKFPDHGEDDTFVADDGDVVRRLRLQVGQERARADARELKEELAAEKKRGKTKSNARKGSSRVSSRASSVASSRAPSRASSRAVDDADDSDDQVLLILDDADATPRQPRHKIGPPNKVRAEGKAKPHSKVEVAIPTANGVGSTNPKPKPRPRYKPHQPTSSPDSIVETNGSRRLRNTRARSVSSSATSDSL